LSADTLQNAGTLCREVLESDREMRAIGEQLAGYSPETLLSEVGYDPASTKPLEAWRSQVDASPHAFERWILLRAAVAAVPVVRQLPVAGAVRMLWAEDARFFAQPPATGLDWFSLDHIRFREMARLATLRRFPAGQFHWEIGGLPGRTALQTPLHQWPALAAVLLQTGGRAPYAEIHVNERRKNRFTLTESEGLRSLYWIAKSLEIQPGVRALFSYGWLACRTTAEVAPRLAWIRRFFVEQGAFVSSVQPAPPDAGFLVGSQERRRLYEQGLYRPLMTYVVWPRRKLLEWADRYQPEDAR
jgi:hypothetical protein